MSLKTDFCVVENGPLVLIKSRHLNKFDNIRHAFTTRLGGQSKGYFGSMNLSFRVGDCENDVRENYRILASSLSINAEDIVVSAQTHTANVLSVGKEQRGSGIFRPSDFEYVDALVTNEKNVAIVTHSADCCLLAFNDPVNGVIAAAHAGWRGTVEEIGKATVLKMKEEYGSDESNILVSMMPSIGPCCYEVDMPVYERFLKLRYLDMQRIFKPKENGKFMLDLWEANKQILCFAGLPESNIEKADICTNCNPDMFHSHRASHGKRGVNGLIMELK